MILIVQNINTAQTSILLATKLVPIRSKIKILYCFSIKWASSNVMVKQPNFVKVDEKNLI